MWTGPCITPPPYPNFFLFFFKCLFLLSLTTPKICLKSKNKRNIKTLWHFIFTVVSLIYKIRESKILPFVYIEVPPGKFKRLVYQKSLYLWFHLFFSLLTSTHILLTGNWYKLARWTVINLINICLSRPQYFETFKVDATEVCCTATSMLRTNTFPPFRMPLLQR